MKIKVRKDNKWVKADEGYVLEVLFAKILGEHILSILKRHDLN